MAIDKTTPEQTISHLIKSNIGTGILAFPCAINYVGILFGSLGIAFVGLVATHCMYILVRCRQLVTERSGKIATSYDQVVEYSFEVGPPCLRPWAKMAARYAALFIQLTQFGVCAVYALFAAENLRAVAINLNLFGDYSMAHIRMYLLCLLPLMCALSCTSSLRKLSYLSTSANCLQIAGLTIVIYNLTQDLPSVQTRPLFTTVSQIPIYFTTIVFAFEGISVVMPVYNAMKKPQLFLGLNRVLNTSMTLVTCVYLTVGFFGYLKFGPEAAPSVTLNLPQRPLYESVRCMFMVAVFLSSPLQLLVPVEYFWPAIARNLPEKWSPRKVQLVNQLYRSTLVTFTFIVAAVVPLLDLIISLVGALCSSTIALIIPPMVQLVVYWPDRAQYLYWSWLVPKNLIVTTIGIFSIISGTYFSTAAILEKLKDV